MNKLLSMILLVGVTWAAEPISLVLKVDNMTCSGCVFTVKHALKKVKGVRKVKVTLNPPVAQVTFDPEIATPVQFVEATAKYGYPSTVYIPVAQSSLPDSLKRHDGVYLMDSNGKKGGILVDPHKVDVLSLLKFIDNSGMNKDKN